MAATPSSPSDASARWRAFVDGEATAFESLFKHYYAALFDYGRRFTGDQALIHDTLQDLFATLWQQRPAIDYFPAYVYRAFRNRLVRALNKLQNQASAAEIGEADWGTDDSVEALWVASEEHQNRQDWLHARINTLSKRQQEVIYLRFFQEQPTDAIAAILHIHPQSVRNLLHEALKALRQTVRGMVGGLLIGQWMN